MAWHCLDSEDVLVFFEEFLDMFLSVGNWVEMG